MRTIRAILAVTVTGALAFSLAVAADREPAKRPAARERPGASVTIKVGQDAPDVALWPLTATTDANGQEVMKIADEPARLSDYKDKAPVVIFSSSYT